MNMVISAALPKIRKLVIRVGNVGEAAVVASLVSGVADAVGLAGRDGRLNLDGHGREGEVGVSGGGGGHEGG